MKDVTVIDRRKALTVAPQALAWDGSHLWLSSRDLGTLYKVDLDGWKIVETRSAWCRLGGSVHQ